MRAAETGSHIVEEIPLYGSVFSPAKWGWRKLTAAYAENL